MPDAVINAACQRYMRHGTPWPRPAWQNTDDNSIVAGYAAEYRGLVQYYQLAANMWRLTRLRWAAETSMLMTLAAKHKSTVSKIANRHRTTITTEHGPRTCFEAKIERAGKPPLIARFGGIPLTPQRHAVLTDRAIRPVTYPAKELPRRLMASRCELCKQPGTVAVHQVRKLAHLGQPGPGQPAWAEQMHSMRRKTLVVCANCHHTIHAQPVSNT